MNYRSDDSPVQTPFLNDLLLLVVPSTFVKNSSHFEAECHLSNHDETQLETASLNWAQCQAGLVHRLFLDVDSMEHYQREHLYHAVEVLSPVHQTSFLDCAVEMVPLSVDLFLLERGDWYGWGMGDL